MYVLRAVLKRGWCPVLITALAVVAAVFDWAIWIVALVLGVILAAGLVMLVREAREKELEASFLRLRQQAGYFTRRFTGNSSLSIFAIIDTMFNVDNPKLWDWARACDTSQRVFNSWCGGFVSRIEGDVGNGGFGVSLPIYLNELWLVNSHYYEFIEQFHEVAEKFEIPRETVDLCTVEGRIPHGPQKRRVGPHQEIHRLPGQWPARRPDGRAADEGFLQDEIVPPDPCHPFQHATALRQDLGPHAVAGEKGNAGFHGAPPPDAAVAEGDTDTRGRFSAS